MQAAPRLGEGLAHSGRLSEAAIGRAARVLARMAARATRLGAGRVEVAATSAVREAANGRAFVDRVRRETGLRVRVLSGADEARLGSLGALAHFDLGAARAAVADIGGGSLELALGAGGVVERLASLPLGALRLTERFLSPQCTPQGVRAVRREARRVLRRELPGRGWRGATVIGSGGTFTSLAAMSLARHRTAAGPAVHGAAVTRAEVERTLDSLQALSVGERRAVAGLDPARADIIVAGLAVLAELLARLDAPRVVVSAYGVREGLLLEAAGAAAAAEQSRFTSPAPRAARGRPGGPGGSRAAPGSPPRAAGARRSR